MGAKGIEPVLIAGLPPDAQMNLQPLETNFLRSQTFINSRALPKRSSVLCWQCALRQQSTINSNTNSQFKRNRLPTDLNVCSFTSAVPNSLPLSNHSCPTDCYSSRVEDLFLAQRI